MREWNPTPAQIRRACLAIQSTWDDAERYRRSVKIPQPSNRQHERYEREPYRVPIIRERDLPLAVTLDSLAS